MAVGVVKRPERQTPSLLALQVIRHQSEVTEEDVDVLAIRNRARGRGRVGRLVLFDSGTRRFFLPKHFTSTAVEADRVEMSALIDYFAPCRTSAGASFSGC